MQKILSYLVSKMQASQSSNYGFTMIELLIVIAILGILAVAVLSAINPIEQINRGRDTGSRGDAEQMLSAIDRYHAFQGYYPWQTGAADVDSIPIDWTDMEDGGAGVATGIVDDNDCDIADKLASGDGASCVGADELKVTFFNKILDGGYNPLYIYNRGSQGDSTYVCFRPQSRAFKTEAITRCGDATGTGLPADLSDIGGTICEDYDDPNATSANIFVCLP